MATNHTPGETLPQCPWEHPSMVACQQDDDGHDGDGPEAILEPGDYDSEWLR